MLLTMANMIMLLICMYPFEYHMYLIFFYIMVGKFHLCYCYLLHFCPTLSKWLSYLILSESSEVLTRTTGESAVKVADPV